MIEPPSDIRRRHGFGTLEIVIITAVLLTIAMLFRVTLMDYAKNLMNSVFTPSVIADIDAAAP